MAGGGGGDRPPWKEAAPPRPTITLPPRSGSMETLFNGGFSPGPMTLLSGFLGDGDDGKSFSQLLAGAMASPVAGAVADGVMDSPSLFSPSQQALTQVSAQASQANSNMHIQAEHSLTQASAATFNTTQQLIPPLNADSWATMTESADHSHSEQRLQSSLLNVDKPADDGYNWRKYGQKQVKGSEFPRSYYKCTHPNCSVKKKVERSLEGHVTAIIYKGEHNHQRPHPNKRSKDTMTSNANSNIQGSVDSTYQGTTTNSMSKMDPESSQATADHLSGTSESEEVGDHETEVDEKNVEPDPKRRKAEVSQSDPASSHRTVTEPRIIVQTTSEVDLLDDGYRWRKYGQKVVKGNPYPRSYYKCTTQGCNVRKHVERASTDPKAVITTYEGKHNHDVPAAKNNSHTMASNTASQLKSHNTNPEKHNFGSRGMGGNEQQPVARLRLKEEQIT
ncbi:hypothetical protein GLYMA_01G053800v4 [Glycine max]|nr:hypothetical protein GLYMA_01G053800v4 [Glycine max]KAH1161743.1 hypothetical protein GYH30_000561 [Glycine max]